MKSLVIAEHEYGQLKPETAKTVHAAAKVGADIDLLLIGEGLEAAAQEQALSVA